MTFFNVSLILGVLSVSIPIALHFLSRRQPKKIIFPSIQLLKQKAEINRSRVRVKKWWLLAFRIAALAALALTLAQPAIPATLSLTWLTISLLMLFGFCLLALATLAQSRGMERSFAVILAIVAMSLISAASIWGVATYANGPSGSLNQLAPQSIAIVLDNGPSVAWKTSDDHRLERMKTVANWVISQLPQSSQVAVIDRSTQLVTFALDASSATKKVEQLDVIESAQPLRSRLASAARLLETGRHERSSIFLISDLTLSAWETERREGNFELSNEKGTIDLTIFDLGQFTGKNRVLSIPKLADATPPKDTPTPLTVTVQVESLGPDEAVSVTAELEMYQNDLALPALRNEQVLWPATTAVDRASTQLINGQPQQLLLTIPALPVGTHHGVVRLIGNDAMPLDDARFFSVRVLPPSKVLLVSSYQSEAQVVASAIRASSNDGATSEYDIESIDFPDLAVVRLEEYDVLILLDPPSKELDQKAIDSFLSQGGRALVAFGSNGQLGDINDQWFEGSVRSWRVPSPGAFLQSAEFQHPILSELSENIPWGNYRVHQYWQVTASENDRVLLEFAGTEHPAMIERQFDLAPDAESETDAGRLLLITTPFPAVANRNRPWNDLFGSNAWPAWLLCRQSIEYLTNRHGTNNMALVGESHSLDLNFDKSLTPQVKTLLFSPNNQSPSPILAGENNGSLIIRDVTHSGTYWLRGSQPGNGFSANLGASKTKLDRIQSDDLSVIFGANQYDLISRKEDYGQSDQDQNRRLRLHSPAMLLVAILFILEQILSNRFYQQRNPRSIGLKKKNLAKI